MATSTVIYQAPQQQFFIDVDEKTIVNKMMAKAKTMEIVPEESEINAWKNNAPKIKEILQKSGVTDCHVTFEYMIPYSRKRVDCMIYGTDESGKGNVVHIELKQWSNSTVYETSVAANFSINDSQSVNAYTGGATRVVAHPSQQVRGYNDYLFGFVEVLSTEEIGLKGVAYCYNYTRHSQNGKTPVLYNKQYDTLQKEFHTYSGDELQELAEDISKVLKGGKGYSVFNKVINSPVKASKKLLDSVAGMLSGDKASSFSLLEDQIAAKNTIYDKIRNKEKDGRKSIVVVHGGPGTGKTVIALNVLAELAKHGKQVRYATKSASLISGIKYQLPGRHEAKKVITSLAEFNHTKCSENDFDVVLVDEAHRIEDYYSIGYGRSKKKLTDMPMIDALLRVTRVLVLFIDDKQAIRSAEVGSSDMIRACATRNNAQIEEITLTSQFRCNGSDNYLDWLDQVLYNKSVTSHFSSEEYDFRIFDSPTDLYEAVMSKNHGEETSRMMAGFCWPWSENLDAAGQPVKDVVIGDFAMPWETHRNLATPPAGYVKFTEWAYRPEGIKQVGCIYTAQGFEFDYGGVIIGPDIRYDAARDRLVTDRTASKDPTLTSRKGEANFDTYVRNIYRVLMSRGMKGTYIYCCDPEVKNYFIRNLFIQ